MSSESKTMISISPGGFLEGMKYYDLFYVLGETAEKVGVKLCFVDHGIQTFDKTAWEGGVTTEFIDFTMRKLVTKTNGHEDSILEFYMGNGIKEEQKMPLKNNITTLIQHIVLYNGAGAFVAHIDWQRTGMEDPYLNIKRADEQIFKDQEGFTGENKINARFCTRGYPSPWLEEILGTYKKNKLPNEKDE